METYIHLSLFIALQICFLVQLYHLALTYKFVVYKPLQELEDAGIPISVIISARNEEDNLKCNLPFILNQKYSNYEVVVVNDCSLDESDMVLRELQNQYPHLKVVTIAEHVRHKTGKKFALTLGIKAATHEHLLFTDADCMPNSDRWVARMALNFTTHAQIVLGYSPYYQSGGLLNMFVRFETLKVAVSYLSAALRGNAYMGVGRNMAYTRSLFFSNKGFAAHMHVLSGDDDLFVNQNATPTNTIIEVHPDTFMHTEAKSTWKDWYRQKTRHMGAGKIYKDKHRAMITADAISGLLFYFFLTVCLVLNVEPLLVLGMYLFRLIVQLIMYKKSLAKLNERRLIYYFPFLDFMYYLYLNIFGLIGTFKKSTQWK